MKHSVDRGHILVQPFNFIILMQIQSKDINIKKIAEAMLIQTPTPDTPGGSLQLLKLF